MNAALGVRFAFTGISSMPLFAYLIGGKQSQCRFVDTVPIRVYDGSVRWVIGIALAAVSLVCSCHGQITAS
jgi:hypothetical protein